MSNRNWGLAACLMCLLLAGCPGGTDPAGSGGVHESGAEDGPAAAAVNPNAYSPEGAVLPTPETVESGEYTPLSRPLFVYVSKASLKKPEVAAFLKFYFSEEARELPAEEGYVKLPDAEFAKSRETLDAALAEAGASPEGNFRGQITVEGSSTVVLVTQAMAEEFNKKHPGVRISVGGSGTGNGFGKFCRGETDINDASRPISESEIALCKQNGIEYVELKCCIDGLTVVTNLGADWLTGLTVADLKKIWEPNSQVKNWSDINPEFPNHPIKLFGPDTGSGTFDYFTEVINGKAKLSRSDYSQATDDNVLVRGVSTDQYALGYFGFAYYVANKDKLKALAIAP